MEDQLRKVTVMLPTDLLERVQFLSGDNLTANIREGLQMLANRAAQRKLLEWRGKINMTINVDELREDRD